MELRLVVTVHLDAFNMAQGGGFTTYDKIGKRQTSVVWPGFPNGEMPCEVALTWIAEQYQRLYGAQLALPES